MKILQKVLKRDLIFRKVTNKKKIKKIFGLMKDELDEKRITKFLGLRART